MIHIMMDINEHQDQRYTRGDNNGRDLYLLGVNVLVIIYANFCEDWIIHVITIWETPNVSIQNCHFGIHYVN